MSIKYQALCLDIRAQNAPSRIAPTKVNTAQTTSTFSFKAKSTSRASLTVDVKPIVTDWRRKPKRESCCGAQRAPGKFRNGQAAATKYLTIRTKFSPPLRQHPVGNRSASKQRLPHFGRLCGFAATPALQD
jgi:hypothetical protein